MVQHSTQPETIEEKVEEALTRLYMADIIPNYLYIKRSGACCRPGNKESIINVIGYCGEVGSSNTFYKVMGVTPVSCMADVCSKTFAKDKVLSYIAFLSRFLEKSMGATPAYVFQADVRYGSGGEGVNKNAALAQVQFGINNSDFMLLVGLYCLYQADDFRMVRLERELIKRLK